MTFCPTRPTLTSNSKANSQKLFSVSLCLRGEKRRLTRTSTLHVAGWLLASVLLCGASIVLFAGCGSVPQVAEDENVYKELDALYTAVTSKRRDLLVACRDRMTK